MAELVAGDEENGAGLAQVAGHFFRNACSAVRKSGAKYIVVRGNWDERFRRAVEAIDELLLDG